MMKLGYNTVREVADEGELKPLTNARIPEGGGWSGITKKKHLLFFALGMVIIGFLVVNRQNDHHLGLPLNKESSMAAQLVDSIEESEIQLYGDPEDPDYRFCSSQMTMPKRGENWCAEMKKKEKRYPSCWSPVTYVISGMTECPMGYKPCAKLKSSYNIAGWTELCKRDDSWTVSPLA